MTDLYDILGRKMTDLYDILHIDKTADKKTIRKAYKKMAAKHHPDRENGDKKMFQMIKHAYETLYDEKSREHYDQHGEAPPAGEKTPLQKAQENIANIFLRLLRNNIDQLGRVDLVQETTNAVSNAKRNNEQQIVKLKQAIKKLEKGKDRLHSNGKEPHPILIGTINQEIENTKRGIVNGEERVATQEAMLELLEDYEWELDAHQ